MLRRNVLIFHAGALGDFVLTWPLGLALGRLYPQSRVIYVVGRDKGKLAERALGLESMDAETGWHRLFGEDASLPLECRRKLEGAHAVFSFVSGDSDGWMSNIRRLAPDAKVWTMDARRSGFAGHASRRLVDSLAQSPAIRTAVENLLASVEANGVGRGGNGDGPVLIHPGAGSDEKCWGVESYIQLAEQMQRDGGSVRFVVGEVELEKWGQETIEHLAEVAPLARPADAVDLWDELAQASGFIGNDSGPSHLAGVMGLPVLALFGPSDPTVWRPLGPHVRTLQVEAFSGLTVNNVAETFASLSRNKRAVKS